MMCLKTGMATYRDWLTYYLNLELELDFGGLRKQLAFNAHIFPVFIETFVECIN